MANSSPTNPSLTHSSPTNAQLTRPRVTQLNRYPIKSVRGLSVSNAQVKREGLEGDRNMMLINQQNIFISQRQFPSMALIQVTERAQAIRLSAPNMPKLLVNQSQFSSHSIKVDVWGSQAHGFVAPQAVNDWFSDYLKTPVRLVSYDHQQPRLSDPQYSQPEDIVSFADGFPLLLISQASLDELNARLSIPVNMAAFRPNIVVDNCHAFAEDSWTQIRVGELVFDLVKACTRCVLTTVDPLTGVIRDDKEPLKTLSRYRRTERGVIFGMNLIPRTLGEIQLNDTLEIIR